MAPDLIRVDVFPIMRRFSPVISGSMARTRNENLHQQRREQILTAAARVFKAKGFHGARTEDICAAADMSAGAVFRYFADKREMIDAIIAVEVERYTQDFNHILSRDGLLGLAGITADELAGMMAQGDDGLGVDSWLELARDAERRPDIVGLDRKMRADLAALLARGQAEGWVRPSLDPAGATNIVFALFNGLWLDRSLGTSVDMKQTAAALGDFFRTYVLVA
ncbi:TetR/AcrR family transcriptional regulator [Burkholderia cenocepacia]|uniref:TetR/AcrR family transcriptional regulator n=1 Tax=Burkholderia cenocepacia TaxID=95486 RepID=UPI001E3544C0|nr:TetR/AcrR family transcriptional regulator [Burkholderia cenocepacia]MCW5144149.1 TetR/AcrR family transcriptional regulator [Burkholderia cenocepacia]MDF0503703.1 TetR/AcrR family transcriptional regulator [Burkholderia cenocepacia]MDR5644952.1 TetR/AcrR family transcriptional regulator [Burkholderia cenocepacia]